MKIPNPFAAGDTLSWKDSLALYPAGQGYTLHYALLKQGVRIVMDSVAYGDDHLFNIPAVTTYGYAAGDYDWQAYATKVTFSHAVTISNANPAVVGWVAHGKTAGQAIAFTTTGTLPAPLSPDTPYYILSAGLLADSFEISLTPGGAAIATTTAGSGTHTVTDWPERYTVAEGRLSIEPNLAAQSAGYDNRTQARKILDSLLAAYETAAASKSFVYEYQIAGRMMRFGKKDEWILEINYWKAEVAKEERLAAIKNGDAPGNRLLVRF